MAHIVLELVRDRNGRVTNVLAINDGDIAETSDGTGYVQVVSGNAVQYYAKDEIVIAKIRE